MDEIQRRFSAMQWQYAEQDPAALEELERRIASAGRAGRTIVYSDLVQGVRFDLPSLKESPRYIDVHAWEGLDRSIVGDFLAEISRRSYERGCFLASALAVTREGVPGGGFNSLLFELGMIPMKTSSLALDVWVDQVRKAQEWYRHGGVR